MQAHGWVAAVEWGLLTAELRLLSRGLHVLSSVRWSKSIMAIRGFASPRVASASESDDDA